MTEQELNNAALAEGNSNLICPLSSRSATIHHSYQTLTNQWPEMKLHSEQYGHITVQTDTLRIVNKMNCREVETFWFQFLLVLL